jgi:hypothetical protein
MFTFLERFNESLRAARDERISPLMLTRWVLNSPRFECLRYGYYGYEVLAHIPIARTYLRLCDYRLAHISQCSHTNGLDPLMAPAIQQITLHKRQKSAIFALYHRYLAP